MMHSRPNFGRNMVVFCFRDSEGGGGTTPDTPPSGSATEMGLEMSFILFTTLVYVLIPIVEMSVIFTHLK